MEHDEVLDMWLLNSGGLELVKDMVIKIGEVDFVLIRQYSYGCMYLVRWYGCLSHSICHSSFY